jgi:hypothetical protein
MFQYGEAILVCPVVEYFAKEEDRHFLGVIVIIPRRLRVKEAVALDFHAAGFECIGHVPLPVLCPVHPIVSTCHVSEGLIRFMTRTSIASPETDSRS